MRSRASHPAGPHDRLVQKNGKLGTHCCRRVVSTQFAQQFVSAVTDPPLVGCVVWSLYYFVIQLFNWLIISGNLLMYQKYSSIYANVEKLSLTIHTQDPLTLLKDNKLDNIKHEYKIYSSKGFAKFVEKKKD